MVPSSPPLGMYFHCFGFARPRRADTASRPPVEARRFSVVAACKQTRAARAFDAQEEGWQEFEDGGSQGLGGDSAGDLGEYRGTELQVGVHALHEPDANDRDVGDGAPAHSGPAQGVPGRRDAHVPGR
eukprot:scaffold19757_cov113-Isochrysis_galbana.AAC.2